MKPAIRSVNICSGDILSNDGTSISFWRDTKNNFFRNPTISSIKRLERLLEHIGNNYLVIGRDQLIIGYIFSREKERRGEIK